MSSEDASRKELAGNLGQHLWGMAQSYGENEKASFLIDMGLGMLGLTDEQEQAVTAAIPEFAAMWQNIQANQALINEAVALYQKSQPLVQQMSAGLNKTMPAITILMNAISAKSQS